MVVHIGIDPGTTGAIAVLDDQGKLLALRDLPRKRIGASEDANAQWRIDGAAFYCLLKEIIPAGAQVRVRYEDVQPYNGAIVMVCTMMMAKGAVLTILDCLPNIDPLPVAPAKWKGFFKLHKEKNPAKSKQKISSEFKSKHRALAVHFWPEAEIRTVEHTDRAEAALIAQYDRLTLAGIKRVDQPAPAVGDFFAGADHNPPIQPVGRRRKVVTNDDDIPW